MSDIRRPHDFVDPNNTQQSGPFEYTALPGRVVFGAGSARRALVDEVTALGGDRVLLVAAGTRAGLADELLAPLGSRVVARFDEIRQHVPVEVAERARRQAAAARADLLVSVGGGSTTGTAKAIAMTTGLPILAVPTTYAGSEMTPVWGLTEAGRKTTGSDPRVLPRTVVYDPDLTRSLPGPLSVASGLNAMAHAVEAFWAPGANPVTDALAADSITALARGLPQVLADGDDEAGRHDVLHGAWLAGAAFAVAGPGLHHTICHVLGGAFDLPHAQTHAVVLPHVLAFYQAAAPVAADRIAAALAGGIGPGVAGAAGSAAATGLFDLARRLNSPHALRHIGLAATDLPAAVDLVTERVAGGALRSSPRPVSRDDVAAILNGAWAGRRP